MNKWIAIPVITILAVGIIVGGYFLWQQTDKLGEAESEVVALEGNITILEGDVSTLEGDVSTLEGDVSTLEGNVTTLEGNVTTLEGNVTTLEGNVTTLETDLADSEATVSTLEADLETANSRITNLEGDVRTQQTINSSLSAELKKVKDPRHFSSLTELTDWVHEDDTETKYEEEGLNVVYILQVRALRDGYLLPGTWLEEGGEIYGWNQAYIGDILYLINASDDYIMKWWTDVTPLPSRPLPLD